MTNNFAANWDRIFTTGGHISLIMSVYAVLEKARVVCPFWERPDWPFDGGGISMSNLIRIASALINKFQPPPLP